MATETRQRMIETAARLFQRDGYCATSWRSLVSEAGTPWGSIHHHFPGGKEELGLAAVNAGSDAVAALIEHCFSDGPDAPSAIARWFALSAELLMNSAYTAGCPVATLALETATSSQTMHQATKRAFDRWQDLLAAELRKAGAAPSDAYEAAATVLVLLEGGLLLARVQAAPRALHLAGVQAVAVTRAGLGSEAAQAPSQALLDLEKDRSEDNLAIGGPDR